MLNKGLFGLYNYENTPLDCMNENDSKKKQYTNAFLQGMVDGIMINGIIYTGTALFIAAKRIMK